MRLISFVCIALLFCTPAAASDDTSPSNEYGFISLIDGSLIDPQLVEEAIANSSSYQKDNIEYVNDYKYDPGFVLDQNITSNPPLLTSSPLSLPAAYDLRYTDNGCMVTSAKDQLEGGTCYAFATIGAAESNAIMKGYATKDTIDLSELQAAYFFWNRQGVSKNLYSYTVPDNFKGITGDDVLRKDINWDQGANAQWLVRQMIAGIGLASEKNSDILKYENIDQMLEKGYGLLPSYATSENAYYVSDVNIIQVKEETRDTIKQMIMEKGAGVIAYDIYKYKEGDVENMKYSRYKDDALWNGVLATTYYYTKNDPKLYNTQGGHAVCLVGWDDDYPVENFAYYPSSKGAWLCKNSYGSDWSDDGFFWISYEDESLGREGVMFLDVIPSDGAYDYLYQYDGGVYDTDPTKYYSYNPFTACNTYTANSNQQITHVSFETAQNNVRYTVNIIKNGVETSVSKKSGLLEHQGYHTIKLATPVTVNAGDTFSIRVTLTSTTGSYVSFPADTNKEFDWIRCVSDTTNTKSSYYAGSYSGVGTVPWTDITKDGNNFRIKAFAENTDAPTSISITGDDSVIVGKSIKLSATVYPSTASSKVSWISSNPAVATIDQNGVITAYSDGQTTIIAASTIDSRIKATKTITVLPLTTSITITHPDGSIPGWLWFTDNFDLKANVQPSTASKKIKWTSSDTTRATVDGNGKITVKDGGKFTITAAATDGSGKKAEITFDSWKLLWVGPICSVWNCDPTPVTINTGEGVDLSSGTAPEADMPLMAAAPAVLENIEPELVEPYMAALESGNPAITAENAELESLLESPEPEPLNAEGPPLLADSPTTSSFYTWVSSNPEVAIVDQNGHVTGISPGVAKISIYVMGVEMWSKTVVVNGTPTPTTTKTATPTPIPTTPKPTVIPTPDSRTLKINGPSGGTLPVTNTYTFTVTPSDVPVSWIISSGTSGAGTINEATGKFTPASAGTVTIKAKAQDGTGRTADYTLKITSAAVQIIGDSIIDMDKTIHDVTYRVNIPNLDKVSWDISPSIARIVEKYTDASGYSYAVISPSTSGFATITAKISGNGYWNDYFTKSIELRRHITSLSINGDASVELGKTKSYSVTITPDDATTTDLLWTSSDKNVATITNAGILTTRNTGQTTITASATDGSGKKATKLITVTPVKVSKITLNPTSATLTVGQGLTILPTITPDNAANQVLDWSSSTNGIIELYNGYLEARKAGTTTVTAKATDGSNIKATCEITVVQPVKSIDISGPASVTINDTPQYTAELTPRNPSNSDVYWSSSDSKILSIDQNTGKAKAIKDGDVYITARAADGYGASKSMLVNVKPRYVTKITISGANQIQPDESTQLTAQIEPKNATYSDVLWFSNASSVAAVDQNTGVVTGISCGDAQIIAVAVDGSGKYSTWTISVKPPAILANSITISGKKEIIIGEKTTMLATVLPENCTDKTVTWNSLNSDIAVINSETGELTGKSAGTATITATANDGSGITVSYKVTVSPLITGITLIYNGKEMKDWTDSVSYSCYTGDNLEITAKVTPTVVANKNLKLIKDFGNSAAFTWEKTSVDAEGNDIYILCPKGAGDFIFYAQATDGSEVKSVEFELYVIEPLTSVEISGGDSIPVGMSTTLTTKIDPNRYDNRNLEWSAEPEGIVSLTPGSDTLSCTVTGIKSGPVTITASAKDGHGASDTHAMTVMQKVTGITLTGKSSIRVEETTQINAVVTPDDATDPTLTWTTDNEEVATVDDKGVVTAKSAGTVKITATAADGSGKSATHTLQIKEADRELYLLNSLSESSSTIYVDDTMSLHAHYYVNDVKIEDKLVYPYQYEWTSSNPSVAEAWYIQIYRNSGGVTAISPGEADITVTVTSANGSKISSTHHVTVSPKPLIDVEVQYLHGISSTEVGNDIILNAHIMDSEYKMQMPFTWESSDSSVATVSKEFSGKATGIGIVTGHKAGTAVISVYPKDRPDSKVSVPVTFTPARTASSVVSLTLYDVPESEVIYIDDICNLAAIAKDADGNVLRDAEISWDSSDTSVAAVSDSGSVSGLKRGVTTITASCLDADGNIARASAVLFVVPEDEPTFLRTNANIYLEDENERVILPLDYSSNYNAETKINVEYYDPTCSSVDDLVCPDLYAVHLFAKVKLSDII